MPDHPPARTFGRVLVTGGAGFIGSAFVLTALADGYPELAGAEITVLDKLTYSGRRENLATVADHPRLRFVRGDLTDEQLLDEVCAGQDAVVHFAAESDVDRSIAYGGRRFVTANVLGTQMLLDAALRHGVGRVLHVSTDEVYGSILDGDWAEDAPLDPRSPYSASKAASDMLVLAYHQTYGLDAIVTRCANNYGPRQYPEKIVPRFVTNLLCGVRVPLYGDGRHVRSWVHVSDHCRGVVLALARGRAGEVYNIGGGTELSNHDLTRMLLDLCGAGWDMVEYVADRAGHDRRYAVDYSKIARELGYRPAVPFEDGLGRTVAWYREHADWWRPLTTPDPGRPRTVLPAGRFRRVNGS